MAIVNSVALNIEVDVFFKIRVSIFSRYMSRIEIAGSYGNSIFSFSRNLQIVLYSATPICIPTNYLGGFPGGASVKESTYQCKRCKRCGFDLWFEKEDMAAHPSVVAWRIPWKEDAGWL